MATAREKVARLVLVTVPVRSGALKTMKLKVYKTDHRVFQGFGHGQIGDNNSAIGQGWGDGNSHAAGNLTGKDKGSGKFHRGIKYYAKNYLVSEKIK
jgi:hypothetical protein